MCQGFKMIDAMLYAQMYASVCVSLVCNIEHAFNEIKTQDTMNES